MAADMATPPTNDLITELENFFQFQGVLDSDHPSRAVVMPPKKATRAITIKLTSTTLLHHRR